MTAPALVARGLRMSFGAVPVLRGVDLSVARGSLTAVLGPSGSGKTTLLRVLAGFEAVEAGEVLLAGRPVQGRGRWVPPEKRGIGYVPQEAGLFPHLSVGRNIGFGLARRERRPGAGVVRRYLEVVGLAGLEQRYPHELSGGQQQRVALARALAIRPKIVLLDEPFSSLDVALRAAVREDVRRVLDEVGTTAVLVTHDQDEALSISDQVALIRDGRIAQCGSPEELYSAPADPETASFIGDANLVPGTSDGRVARTPLGEMRLIRPLPGAERVLVLIRPEQIELVPPGGPGLPALVRSRQYFGHDCVLHVQPEGGAAGGLPRLTMRRRGGHLPDSGSVVRLCAAGATVAWPA